MKNPLTRFVRWRALKKRRSDVPTAIRPLSRITAAAVFIDGSVPTVTADIDLIRDRFSKYGIRVHVYAFNLTGQVIFNVGQFSDTFIQKENIGVFGMVRRNDHTPEISADEDLFISVFDPDCYAVEFAACCSKAVFKAGLRQIPGDVYDLVLSDDGGKLKTQAEKFNAIFELIERIK